MMKISLIGNKCSQAISNFYFYVLHILHFQKFSAFSSSGLNKKKTCFSINKLCFVCVKKCLLINKNLYLFGHKNVFHVRSVCVT